MENKNFNITEILESVDSIVGNKKKIVETKKQFDIKKFDTTFNKETEKIIIDAEKAQDDRKLNNKSSEVLILNNPTEDDISDIKKTNLSSIFDKTLILSNEFSEDEI